MEAMFAASLAQSSLSSWTIQRLSIHMYGIFRLRTNSTASWNVWGSIFHGIFSLKESILALRAFSGCDVPQQWLRQAYWPTAPVAGATSRIVSMDLPASITREGRLPCPRCLVEQRLCSSLQTCSCSCTQQMDSGIVLAVSRYEVIDSSVLDSAILSNH